MSESDIEQRHSKDAEAEGWFVDKIMRTSRNSFPDRFYAKAGRVVLIEWKSEDGVLSPQQRLRHKQLRDAGVEVYVTNDVRQANRILGIGNEKPKDLRQSDL